MRNLTTYKKLISGVSIICALLLALCGCGERFEMRDNRFFDTDTEISYQYAPMCYAPISRADNVFGTDGDIEFFEILGKDPALWLCDGDGTVFYADGAVLPTPSQMSFTYAELCRNNIDMTVALTITDNDVIGTIIRAYLEDAQDLTYPNITPARLYTLRFADTSAGLYYVLEFISYAEGYTVDGKDYGCDFLYNRYEDRFVAAPEALLSFVESVGSAAGDA